MGARTRRVPAWLRAGGIAVGAVVVVAALAWIALVYVLPPTVLGNLTTESTPVDTVEAVPGTAMTVTVPAGWPRQHPPFHPDTLVVHSPDGVLEVTFRAASGDPAAAFAGLGGAADPAADAPVTETLASGLTAVHAVDGPSLVTVLGVVGGDASLGATARVSGAEITAYLPTLAELFDGVRAA